MPLKTEPLEDINVNLTSMIDVVMLLIVFFMVGTKFSEEERQTGIQVPSVSDSIAMSGQPDEIIVNVDVDGNVTVHNNAQSLESLTALLGSAHENFPGQAVVIRADGRGVYQTVMDVMSACKASGIKNISLAYYPSAKGSG
jgi:biopolymer transport protein ExbD